MKQTIFEITSNEKIARDTYRMVLTGDTADITRPGQFVNLQLEGRYLRRPISVCDRDGDCLTLIYKVVGEGTAQMAGCGSGKKLDLLTGLGNGYDTSLTGDVPLLIGGGVGVPPLYLLAKDLLAEGKNVKVLCGFRTAADAILCEEFRSLGAELTVATEDGSLGVRGFVTDAMKSMTYTHVCTCGPEPMLKAVYRALPDGADGQFSFEERMGCGFGACMGCSCKTVTGYKRICRDGPVLRKNEILWEGK
ncbi:MAG: dihydroorotate dehydrogenase electron transfer subunit [Eubacteriales bacterium]